METIKIALKEYGKTGIPGTLSNPEVLKYFKEIGQSWVTDDDTAWCSAFANWVAKKAGLPMSNSLAARSWLKIGTETKEPEMGDIVVYWRIAKDSAYGHVGFFIKRENGYVHTLGGNQANQVCMSKYPESTVLGYRKLALPSDTELVAVPKGKAEIIRTIINILK